MEILQNILYIILTGCGIGVAAYVIKLINSKVDEIQVTTELNQYDKLNQYIDAAQEVIENAVLTVSQTYVDSLKSSGKFDEEAQKEAKSKATQIAESLISEASKEAIIILHGDFNVYVDSAIEALVKHNK